MHHSEDLYGQSIGLPAKQGSYDPQFEHDACGVGMVATSTARSRTMSFPSADRLANYLPRCRRGAEPNTGDGAGHLFAGATCLPAAEGQRQRLFTSRCRASTASEWFPASRCDPSAGHRDLF